MVEDTLNSLSSKVAESSGFSSCSSGPGERDVQSNWQSNTPARTFNLSNSSYDGQAGTVLDYIPSKG
eukprot:1845911-Karenia_brevis.AAC.1